MKQYLLLILLTIAPCLKAMDESQASSASTQNRLYENNAEYQLAVEGMDANGAPNASFTRHMRVHSGERPFVVDLDADEVPCAELSGLQRSSGYQGPGR